MNTRFKNLDRLRLPDRPPDASAQFERVLAALVNDYGAERIVAFGSCTRAEASEHSDVDLCVVRRHPPGSTKPALEARLAAFRSRPCLSLGLLVRTPDEWQLATQRPFGIMAEVICNGVVLYERCSFVPKELDHFADVSGGQEDLLNGKPQDVSRKLYEAMRADHRLYPFP